MRNVEDIKAAIFIIYFGALPNYFDIWRHTAQLNNRIHFHVFGDSVQTSQDKNVSYHALSIDEFNNLTLMKTEHLELRSGYKVCDFRPLIAELFPELISNYQYWGFGDFDVLCGDILSVVGDSLGKFDYVSTGWEGESGPLAFLLNSEKVNTLWRSISGIHSKLNETEYIGIDEHEILDALKQKCSCDIVFRECLYDLPAQWHEGKLHSLRQGTEYALYHFGGAGLRKPKSRIIKKAPKLIEHIRRGGAIRISRRNNLVRSGLISMIVSSWTTIFVRCLCMFLVCGLTGNNPRFGVSGLLNISRSPTETPGDGLCLSNRSLPVLKKLTKANCPIMNRTTAR